MPTLQPYQSSDRDELLAIFDANIPQFFAPGERGSFVEFLAQPYGDFRVLRDDEGKTIGCGGIMVDERGTASLVWGMVDPPYQGIGFGWWMALERLSWIAAMPNAVRVALDTSQETAGFYARLGFRTLAVHPHGYGPGLHRHDMEMDVDAAFRKRFGFQPDAGDATGASDAPRASGASDPPDTTPPERHSTRA